MRNLGGSFQSLSVKMDRRRDDWVRGILATSSGGVGEERKVDRVLAPKIDLCRVIWRVKVEDDEVRKIRGPATSGTGGASRQNLWGAPR